MLGTFAVSWFWLCISVLAGSQAGDNFRFRSRASVDGDLLLVCSLQFSLPPYYCARILLLARRMCAVPPCLHAVLGQNLVPGYGVEGRTMVGHIPPPCPPAP